MKVRMHQHEFLILCLKRNDGCEDDAVMKAYRAAFDEFFRTGQRGADRLCWNEVEVTEVEAQALKDSRRKLQGFC